MRLGDRQLYLRSRTQRQKSFYMDIEFIFFIIRLDTQFISISNIYWITTNFVLVKRNLRNEATKGLRACTCNSKTCKVEAEIQGFKATWYQKGSIANSYQPTDNQQSKPDLKGNKSLRITNEGCPDTGLLIWWKYCGIYRQRFPLRRYVVGMKRSLVQRGGNHRKKWNREEYKTCERTKRSISSGKTR